MRDTVVPSSLKRRLQQVLDEEDGDAVREVDVVLGVIIAGSGLVLVVAVGRQMVGAAVHHLALVLAEARLGLEVEDVGPESRLFLHGVLPVEDVLLVGFIGGRQMRRVGGWLGVAAVVHVHVLELVEDRQAVIVLAPRLAFVTLAAEQSCSGVLSQIKTI